MSETAVEAAIQAKGLNAPRITPAMIDRAINGEQYYVFPGSTLTICALTLRNGFVVTGESAAASPENFDEEIGRKIARDNARAKIWALEGYLLRDRLANGGLIEQQINNFAAWLTTRDYVVEIGASKDAAPMAELVREFVDTRLVAGSA
jgi:hypothetical protein